MPLRAQTVSTRLASIDVEGAIAVVVGQLETVGHCSGQSMPLCAQALTLATPRLVDFFLTLSFRGLGFGLAGQLGHWGHFLGCAHFGHATHFGQAGHTGHLRDGGQVPHLGH